LLQGAATENLELIMLTNYQLNRLVRPKDACLMLGITAPTLWRWSREREDFPKPIKLGEATTAWRVSELEAFIERRASRT
jgi:predicted DNA-binding transcriptional regulator AlpA